MNKEILNAQISNYCFNVIMQLCKITGIWIVPCIVISDSREYSGLPAICACYEEKHCVIRLFQDKLSWNNLDNVVAHEWWHAVQWQQDRQIMRVHKRFLKHLHSYNIDDFAACVLEDLSPVEVAARIFEDQRQHTAARNYLRQQKHDYRDLQNGDPWGIYHRLKQKYPLLLTDNVKILE